MKQPLRLLELLILLSVYSYPATYYVAPSGGTWKTVAQVNAHAFAAGDVVLFQRGATWLEKLINISSGVTYSAYGNGAPPTLFGFDIMYASNVTVDQLNIANPASSAKAFALGHFTGGSNNRATYLTFSGQADRALYCQQSTGCLFQGNTVPDIKGSFGIVFFDSNDAKAYHNTVTGNGIGIATNASIEDLSGCTDIMGNTVLYTDTREGDGEAIEVTGNASPLYTACATVHENHVTGRAYTYSAIDAQDTSGSHVYGNYVDGIFTRYNMQWTTSTNLLIEDNVMTGATTNAFTFSSAVAGYAVTVQNNLVNRQSALADPPAFIATDNHVMVTQTGNTFVGPGLVCNGVCK